MAEERSLEDEWRQFKALDIAPNAPEVQLTEMRKAFYAGAASALGLMTGSEKNQEQRRLVYMVLLDEVERYLASANARTLQGRSPN
jgi:hypothetical protein